MRYVLAIAVMLAWTDVSLAAHARRHVDHRYPGYGAAPGYGASETSPTDSRRSWIEQQHYLDPCHCSDGI
jgi:hypothetical protein